MHNPPTVARPPFEVYNLQRAVAMRSNNFGGTSLVLYGVKPIVPGMTSGWEREIRSVGPTEGRSKGR